MALPAAMVLSGLPQEQFTGNLQIVFNHGTVLLKSPSSSSSSSSTSTASSSSSSSSSSSPCDPSEISLSPISMEIEKSLDYYLDVIDKLEQRFQLFESRNQAESVENEGPKIMYESRDLLDLAKNLKSDWTFRHAVLKEGVSDYLENRSLFSRVLGVEMPPHNMMACKDDECSFEEPPYY